MPVKIGIRFWSESGTGAEQVRYAMLAEKHGLDYCWIVNDLFKRSSLAVLPAIAANTKRIILGPCILNPYTINPAEIASYLATLDEISNGRVVLGISAGAPKFLDWAGIHARKPLTRTKEAIEAIRRILSGQRGYHGAEINWTDEAQLRFTANRNRIPVYLGCAGQNMLKLAGKIADGALPILFPPEYAQTAVPTIMEAAKTAGRKEEIDIAGCIWFSISKKNELAEDALRSLIAYYAPHIPSTVLGRIGISPAEVASIEAAFRKDGLEEAKKLVTPKMYRMAISGTPDQCLERIAELVKLGVTQINIGPPIGPDLEEAIRLIGTEVAPQVRELN